MFRSWSKPAIFEWSQNRNFKDPNKKAKKGKENALYPKQNSFKSSFPLQYVTWQFFCSLQRPRGLLYIYTVLLYTVIGRHSDHTVGSHRAENGTRHGQPRSKVTNHYSRPTHLQLDHYTSLLDHHTFLTIVHHTSLPILHLEPEPEPQGNTPRLCNTGVVAHLYN